MGKNSSAYELNHKWLGDNHKAILELNL